MARKALTETVTRPAPSSAGPTIGLALGGGGARGFAHIPVIEAIAEMGLRPSIMAGTSIGAIIATGFATGIQARDVIHYAERLVGSHRHAIKHILTHQPQGVLELFNFKRSGAAILRGEAILDMALPELMQHSFETLSIPTLTVATDFNARRQKVFDSGPLKPALAASVALPSLFSPVVIDGHYYIDGGMTNPLPYDIIQDRADIIIAVDVTGGQPRDENKAPSTTELLFGSIQIALHALVDAKVSMRPPDVLIEPPVKGFRVLDFFKLHQILKAAEPVKETVKRALDEAITACERRKTGS